MTKYSGLRPFQPGTSGNPSGRPKGLARMVRETVGDDIVAIVKAQVSIAKGEAPDGIRIPMIKASDMTKAAEWLSDRGWGKAHQTIDIGTDLNLETVDLTKLSDEQLDDFIAKATAESSSENDDTDHADPTPG